MRTLFVQAVIVFFLAGLTLSHGEQDARINIKQLVKNQIAQIRAREIKQELPASEQKAPETRSITESPSMNETKNFTNSSSNEALEEPVKENRSREAEKPVLKSSSQKSEGGIFMKLFILVDLSLAAAVFVYWRRRQLKIGMAEKAQFKKNISKLRKEGKFSRKSEGRKDEIRKKLKLHPAIDIEDEAMLLSQAKKLSVPAGELMLASRLKALEKVHE